MSNVKRQTVLGQRGFEVIRNTGQAMKEVETAAEVLDSISTAADPCSQRADDIAARLARREWLEKDLRPTPGTSELLANIEGEFAQGSRTVPVHDLTKGRLAPVHLVRRK